MSEFDIDEFRKLIENQVENDKFSGTVLVAKDDKIMFKEAYGMASKTFDVPNEIDTKYNIGSLNKLITKIAILQLVQAGKVVLDDFVGKHLPEFREDIASSVRIRHLITFTSGLGDYFGQKFDAALGRLRKVSDFVPFFIDDPLLSKPGEKRNYSNAGYVVLGLIIEAATGMDYYDYVRENIYAPAGMMNTDHYEVDSATPKMATGYTRMMPGGSEHPNKRRCNYFIIGSRGSPAGGGYSTVEDFLLLDNAIANNDLLNSAYSNMVLRPLEVDPGTPLRVIAMAGGAPGLTALYIKFFEFGLTFIVMSNYDPEDVEPLAEQIRDLVIPKFSQSKVVRQHDNC
ncbi:MAG: class A beta-lactamase-related serine hydrolase [Candidatus Thorarchaeota archaeon]|nr:class A beta-lactamase-related serine hydrolase [Candidatus Thorarchaeota archaeon]